VKRRTSTVFIEVFWRAPPNSVFQIDRGFAEEAGGEDGAAAGAAPEAERSFLFLA
jgi:hypothetical protein